MSDVKSTKDMLRAFKKRHEHVATEMTRATFKQAASSITVTRLVGKVLQVRRFLAGTLLKAVRSITKIILTEKKDFGEDLHCMHSEPYFYEGAYVFDDRPSTMSVDEHGQCRPAGESSEDIPQSWKCNAKCKPLSESEVASILGLKSGFEESMLDVRKLLDRCDNCPNNHYSKAIFTPDEDPDSGLVHHSSVERMGHSLICFTGNECQSKLRILRAASTHYPVLRSFLRSVYSALNSHKCVAHLDESLSGGDFKSLMRVIEVDFESLFSNQVQTSHELFNSDAVLRRPDLEKYIQIKHAKLMAVYKKQLEDYPLNPCCSCNCLFKRKQGTKVHFSDELGKVWSELKKFILKEDPGASEKSLFMCNYCKSNLRKGKMPPRCVMNGLQTIPIPKKLSELDELSKQLIQRAKAFQTVVRLGTYTKKVPAYNSLKACKGSMFFLPLPLSKTLETLDEVEGSLADPELYIMVNNRPTDKNVVWRSLVDVNKVKAAINELRECNWLYKGVDEASVDSAAKQVVEEVVNSTSSTMLEKASKSDVAGLQCYTVRNMNDKLSTVEDIEQYKLNRVQEEALDCRQKYLDVMCFPVLFPDGNFGKYHPRPVNISHSEYDKSRIFNKDSRFRKNMQYVFYLTKQKETRELVSGMCNLLKTSKSMAMNVTNMLQKLNANDQQLEANISTMFQSIRGTKQYWFLRRSELMCMLRELGPQSLFLMFSCAEYDSPDIAEYLRAVNDVPQNYSIGKLCTEDPISVSRQFSHKFHAYFQELIVKGQVLGPVSHYYWKKDYQARGAPHYHVLLWINGAPVIGVDDPDKVLAWIEERITCHIPDKENNPDLHDKVIKYQLHKCSDYCRRKRKHGGTFVTYCKSGFPRPAREKPVLHNVNANLKKFQKVYEVTRAECQVRVNDYNPVLLLNWGANMDIQFIGDDGMVCSTYASGYTTKAERGHMQDQYDQIASNKSVASNLMSIGRMALQTREMGGHECYDHISGDHLFEKSAPVQWVDVRMPHKRNRRLKNHAELLKMESVDPNSEDIFLDNFLSTYYPERPEDLEDVCLHDFVANYNWQGKDAKGDRIYRRLNKPRLVNHREFDLNKAEHREDYFYSLILLFVPFRDESSLLRENETAEQAFERLLPDDDNCAAYHRRLQAMLSARAKVRSINEARKAAAVQEEENKEADGLQVLGEAKSAMQDMQDMDANPPNALTLEQRVDMLNADQRRVYDSISSHLSHQKRHEDSECQCDMNSLTMFVSGVGGTGKSFLIEAVKSLTDSLWPSEDLKCAITAPTGLAAFIVGGVTVHRLFQLPIEHEGKEAGYWSLSKDSQKVMKMSLRHLKLLVIDEVSMVSSLNLTYVHLRMQELFGGDEWFGGKNVLFVGDLLQLQPVNGNPVFEKMTKSTLVHKLGCLGSVNIWQDCVTYEELTINERQKKDGEFSAILDCVRRGSLSEQTISVLKERVSEVSVAEKFTELQEAGMTPVCLFPTRKQCDAVNEEMLGLLDSEVHVIPCSDVVDETKSTGKWHERAAKRLEKLNQDCNNTAGLEAVLKLAVGARVMLRRNIDVKGGLVNGAIGTIVKVFAKRISIKFDHLDDPCDIEQVKGKFMVLKSYYVYRTQFPLILAYAVTIHKCQGLSLDCAIVDLSDRVFADGMAYVALSRVRSLEGLHLIAFDPCSIKVNKRCLTEINRLRESYRKDLPLYDIPTTSSKKRKTDWHLWGW